MKRLFIKITGIVQGVGFRPFVYNCANNLGLKGWVNNNSNGVYIDLEGNEENLKSFIHTLNSTPPPLSKIEDIFIEEENLFNYKEFSIRESQENNNITLISPDIATCNDCLNDIKDPNNRRYGYAFTNCTNCGPRFSIIKSIPYDRDKTTMAKFNMCHECYEEYTNSLDRRFHAEPNACSHCGPKLWLADKEGNELSCKSSIKYAQNLLKEGKILAIKGLCGFHLACDGKNEKAINLLRVRKRRPLKPFALMVKDINTAEKYCHINSKEREILAGAQKPILLLNKKDNCSLPLNIAPNQCTLGIMLPYTPLHTLLFEEDLEVLIMTSANISGLPLEYTNEKALEHLKNLVDFFLFHNRDIHIPVDDSIVRVINNQFRLIRRARGYVPMPINYSLSENILACGANMKNTFSISKDKFIFISGYNGDLENIETLEHYKRNIEHFKNIFSFKPKYIAYDMHPEYNSTKYALSYDIPKIPVQHHHAHIVSCMVENKINSPVIGLSFDGTGYGTDGAIWGGEFLLCTYENFKRLGHLNYMSLPGGDMAIREPFRMAISLIYETAKSNPNFLNNLNDSLNCSSSFKSIHELIDFLYGYKGNVVYHSITKNINCINTSSMGRLFDGVSSIVDVTQQITYEGQAAIELENEIYSLDKISMENFTTSYTLKIVKENHKYIIKPYKMIEQLLLDKFNGTPKNIMSLKFHNSIIKVSFQMCKILREKTGINSVALSGGIFQNAYILENLINTLDQNGFHVFSHSIIPTNDSGISLGQILIASKNI